jgi:hypothetical protein
MSLQVAYAISEEYQYRPMVRGRLFSWLIVVSFTNGLQFTRIVSELRIFVGLI